MRKVFRVFLYILLAFAFVAFLIVMPIADLKDKENVKTVEIIYATKVLEVKHSIDYIIPFGKDYYYMGVDNDGNIYTIHAPKDWEDNFSENGDRILKVTALSKKITDYDISKKIKETANEVGETDFPLGSEYCLEITYVKDSFMKIISGTALIILIAIGLAFRRRIESVPRIFSAIYCILLIAVIILMLVSIV